MTPDPAVKRTFRGLLVGLAISAPIWALIARSFL